MKKLSLMVCTAALFCIAGAVNAQQQDQRSNQYRNTQNQQRTDTTASDNDQIAVQPAQQESDVEIVESKEGPNSEVVYRYQGELFYVDRDEKKLVKADESELKDATHKTIVKDNTLKDNKDNQ